MNLQMISKYLQIVGFIIQVQDSKLVLLKILTTRKLTGGGTIELNTKIDKSSIKKGDLFQVLRRNEQVVDGSFTVSNVDSRI